MADAHTADIEAFCQRVGPQLTGTLTVICQNRAIAEELTQETLIRVWDRWERVGGLDNPAAWAHHVAINLARSWWRRVNAERRAHSRMATPQPTTHADATAGMAVGHAVLQLPARQRTVLALRYYADLSIADTATAMGCATGTVKSLTAKALDNLRRSDHLAEEATHGR